jgi:hypothetical protein
MNCIKKTKQNYNRLSLLLLLLTTEKQQQQNKKTNMN